MYSGRPILRSNKLNVCAEFVSPSLVEPHECMIRSILSVVLVCLLHAPLWAQRLDVEPRSALVDAELSIRVMEVEPGQTVTIRSAMKDARGRMWRASAVFNADAKGTIDLRSQAPETGDYSDVDPMGLIHAMQLQGNPEPHTRFLLPMDEPVRIRFNLEVDSTEHASVDATRNLAIEGLKDETVSANGLAGRFYAPPGNGPFPGVLVLGGSSGGFSGAIKARLLASHGFAVLTVAYFGAEGVPSSLKEIPIEYFKKAIGWLSAQNSVAPGGVAAYGTSRGSEAALLLAAHDERVRRVVAVAPSHVVWTCICDEGLASSWSLDGTPLPFATPRPDPSYHHEPGTPFRVVTRFMQGLKDQEAVEAARIPVEKINGPILLVSGTDDQLWPSTLMAETIMQQLQASGFDYPYKHIAIKGAGHSIRSSLLPLAGTTTTRGGRILLGGTYEGVRRSASSWPEIIDFLREEFALEE